MLRKWVDTYLVYALPAEGRLHSSSMAALTTALGTPLTDDELSGLKRQRVHRLVQGVYRCDSSQLQVGVALRH